MPHRNASDAVKGSRFTLGDFYAAGRERLALVTAAGDKHLGRILAEPVVNRVGLALTGFYKCFAWRRLQLLGNAEVAYLASLSAVDRERRFDGLLAHRARSFVFTARHRATEYERRRAAECGAVIWESPLPTRVFSRIAGFILERLGSPRTAIYGTMVEVCGLGVLIEGSPGLGKSETALGLIKRGSALIADDLTCIRKDPSTNLLFGSASESTAGYMEIRGIGILHVPRVFGVNALRGEKRLQAVITFKRLDDIREEVDRIGQTRRKRTILGVDVPNVVIPVSEGRDLVNLVETAAQQLKLIATGYDPVAELSARLHSRAARRSAALGKGHRNDQ